jgi:hypothetical protein
MRRDAEAASSGDLRRNPRRTVAHRCRALKPTRVEREDLVVEPLESALALLDDPSSSSITSSDRRPRSGSRPTAAHAGSVDRIIDQLPREPRPPRTAPFTLAVLLVQSARAQDRPRAP